MAVLNATSLGSFISQHAHTHAAEWHRQDAHNSSCAHGTRLSSAPLRSGSVRFVQPVERAQLSQLAVLLHAIVVVVVVCRLILTAMQGEGGREVGKELETRPSLVLNFRELR